MDKASRWKGILVPVVAYLVYYTITFIPIFFSRFDFLFNQNDWVQLYMYKGVSFFSYTMAFAFYLKFYSPATLQKEFAKSWTQMLIPFYNSTLFFKIAKRQESTKNCSNAFGISWILTQACIFFPWKLLDKPYDYEARRLLTDDLLIDSANEIIYALLVISWVVFVFRWFQNERSLAGTTKEEKEDDNYKRIYLTRIANGIGPRNEIFWVFFIVGSFVLTFLTISHVDMFVYNSSDEFIREMNLGELCFLLWAMIWRLFGTIFLIAFIYKTWNTLNAVNSQESKSGGMLIFGWFIPFYNLYWMFAAFAGWRKSYQAGMQNLGIHAEKPDKRILNLAGFASLFYFLHFIPEMYSRLQMWYDPRWAESETIIGNAIYYLRGLLESEGLCSLLMMAAFTAFILHVAELQKSVQQSAIEKINS